MSGILTGQAKYWIPAVAGELGLQGGGLRVKLRGFEPTGPRA